MREIIEKVFKVTWGGGGCGGWGQESSVVRFTDDALHPVEHVHAATFLSGVMSSVSAS